MRGYIRKRGKASWSITIELDRGADGKRRQAFYSCKGTKKDAQAQLTTILYELKTGGFVEPSRLTVGAFLEKWLDHVEHTVAGKTYDRYAEICRRHLIPALGTITLTKLQPLHVQDFYRRAMREGRLNGKGGLSAQSVLHFHRVFRAALKQATRWQLVVRNVADDVDAPKPVKREMRALTSQETATLLRAVSDTRLYMPTFMAATTGLRRGELLAVRWSDVDFDRATLTVRRSVEQVKGTVTFKAPKTAKGRRQIVLLAITVDALRKHRAEQAQERLSMGKGYADQDLVFADINGDVWIPSALTGAFRRLVRDADLGHVRFHVLRHSHATQLLIQGIHPKVVSERLGHSTISITLDTYSHVLPGIQEEAAEKLDAALRDAIAKS
jgi:integrase